MYRKCTALFLGLLILLSVASGCNRAKDSSKDTATAGTVEKPATTIQEKTNVDDDKKEEVKKEDFVFPVEGVRPYAVMIDNEGSRPLPQGGIDKAQLVYEVIVEGGVTRLMPVFWNTAPELIGPVRSSRHYFLDYVMEHDAIYVHFGWSPRAQMEIPKFKIDNINGVGRGGEVFWDLTNDRKNWQDSYTSAQKLNDCVKRLKYRTTTDKKPVLAYNLSETELSDGQKAEKVEIKYSSGYKCSYTYDAASKKYLRFRQSKPHVERTSNLQFSAKNIIIQYTANARIKGDTKDRQELDNVGKGSGVYISCGKAMDITWSKASRTAQTKYMDKNGNKILLNPGQTWIQIVPRHNKAVIE